MGSQPTSKGPNAEKRTGLRADANRGLSCSLPTTETEDASPGVIVLKARPSGPVETLLI